MLVRARTMVSDLLGRDLTEYAPFAWYWPHNDVQLPDGSRVTEFRQTKLPDNRYARRESLRNAILNVDAYAFLMVVPREDGTTSVYFESTHGAQGWLLRPFPGGRVLRAMEEVPSYIGILFRPTKNVVQLS